MKSKSKTKNKKQIASVDTTPLKKADVKKSSAPVFSREIGFNWLFCALLMISGYMAFNSAFDHQFVNWDDQYYVEEQPLVLEKQTGKLMKTPISLNYHPITMLSLSAQVPDNLKDLNAKPFIKFNVWLHLLNTILLFWLVWMLADKRSFVAFIVAALFALHPLHVESVVWVSERKDVLYTFFFLASCITYIRFSITQKKFWYLITLVLFLASVLSKAMAVVLPLVLILIDYWRGRKWFNLKVLLEKIPFFSLSLFFGMMALDVQKGGDFHHLLTLYGEKVKAMNELEAYTFLQRIQFASYGFIMYINKFFFPFNLCTFYPYPNNEESKALIYSLAPLAMLSVLGGALFSTFKTKNRLFIFGIGFYFVTIALVLQFISVGVVIMADRYTYIPYIGLSFMLVYGLDKAVANKSSLIRYIWWGAALLFTLFLFIKTKSQVETWKDNDALWTQVLKYYPKADQAYSSRGNNYGKKGRIDLAMKDFEKAISDGCTSPEIYDGLGNCYGMMSSNPDKSQKEKSEFVQKAISMYKVALDLDGLRGKTWYNLGISQIETNPAASITAFEKALEVMSYKEADIRSPLGYCYLATGNYQKALENYNKAIAFNVKADFIYYNRGLARKNLGDITGANQDFEEALRLNPNNQEAKKALGR